MKDLIVNYWLQLEKREQWVLGLGVVIVSFILLYAFILKPWHKAISEMSERIPRQRENIVWMRQAAEMLKNGASEAPKTVKDANKSLLSIVNKTARSNKVNNYIQQMDPSKKSQSNIEQVNVVLEEADFNKWVVWVNDLHQNYSVNISQLSVEKESDDPNIVEVRVTFDRI